MGFDPKKLGQWIFWCCQERPNWVQICAGKVLLKGGAAVNHAERKNKRSLSASRGILRVVLARPHHPQVKCWRGGCLQGLGIDAGFLVLILYKELLQVSLRSQQMQRLPRGIHKQTEIRHQATGRP